MPAELRQVGGNLVPGVGASSRGPGGGGRGAGLPGRTRFCSAERPAGVGYCLRFGPARLAPGQAGRRGGVSAPPGGVCKARGGAAGSLGTGRGHPGRCDSAPGSEAGIGVGAPQGSAQDRCLGGGGG